MVIIRVVRDVLLNADYMSGAFSSGPYHLILIAHILQGCPN